MFRSKGRVEDDVFNVDNPFGRLVHDLVPFKSIPFLSAKSKIPGRAVDVPYASTFLMTESGMGHGVSARRLTFFPVARLRNL